MKKIILNNLWLVTFISAVALLFTHSFKLATIAVDSTSVLLLIIILVSPFIASVKKIKYGDFEAEIDPKEVQKIKNDVEKNSPPKESESEQPEIHTATEFIQYLAESDPVIALAKVRIELEKNLNRLARTAGIEIRRPALGMLIKSLSNHEIISPKTGKSLSEVISLCNRAIHGETVSEDTAQTIVSVGIDLIEEIYDLVQNQIASGFIVSEIIISDEEAKKHYETKKYQLTTIIPLVDDPKKIVREFTQEQLNEFFEDYNEYAEFIVKLVEIPVKTANRVAEGL